MGKLHKQTQNSLCVFECRLKFQTVLYVFSLMRHHSFVQELMKKPTIRVPTSKHLERLAELEQTVAEQDISLSSLTEKLKLTAVDLERQKTIIETQAKKHADEISK